MCLSITLESEFTAPLAEFFTTKSGNTLPKEKLRFSRNSMIQRDFEMLLNITRLKKRNQDWWLCFYERRQRWEIPQRSTQLLVAGVPLCKASSLLSTRTQYDLNIRLSSTTLGSAGRQWLFVEVFIHCSSKRTMLLKTKVEHKLQFNNRCHVITMSCTHSLLLPVTIIYLL